MDKQSDRKIDRKTDRQIDRQTDRQIDRQIHYLLGWFVEKQTPKKLSQVEEGKTFFFFIFV